MPEDGFEDIGRLVWKMNKMFSFCVTAAVTAGKHLTSFGSGVRTPIGFKAVGIHEALELDKDREALAEARSPGSQRLDSTRPGPAERSDKNERQISTNSPSSGESKKKIKSLRSVL